MLMRIALLFLCLAPAATAQTGKRAWLQDMEVCASLGTATDLSDIDQRSCHPIKSLYRIDTNRKVIWLRGHISLPPGAATAGPLGLYTGALASRELWWNGQLIGRSGQTGSSQASEIPGELDISSWISPDRIRDENDVAIRYSSFHLPVAVGTPLHYIYVDAMAGYSRALLQSYGLSLTAAGALIVAAVFFGLAFISNRRALGSLFIALMSAFATGQLWFESLRGLISYLYPMQIWRLIGVAGCALIFSLSLTAYVGLRLVPGRWRLYVALATASAAVLAMVMPGFDGLTLGLVMGPALVSLGAAIHGMISRAPGATIGVLGLSAFLALQFVETTAFLDQTYYFAICVIVLVLFIDQLRELRRAQEAAELAKRRAAYLELELLKRRIAPHFLMNTLNALTEWVESDPKAGVKMIEALAGEFRLLSQISDRAVILLGEEIALCRRHLEVMSFRVDKPMSLIVKDVDETMQVPPGVLHTLVENAFTHGRFPHGGEFMLTSEREQDRVQLVLVTPPAQRPETAKEPRGEGLAYVRRRLDAAFGAKARVESGAVENSWRTVLTIPREAVS